MTTEQVQSRGTSKAITVMDRVDHGKDRASRRNRNPDGKVGDLLRLAEYSRRGLRSHDAPMLAAYKWGYIWGYICKSDLHVTNYNLSITHKLNSDHDSEFYVS